MGAPRIVIFGGNSDQLFQVTQLIPGYCQVSVFPLNYLLTSEDMEPLPLLILIIPGISFEAAKKAFRPVRDKFPKTSILFIADNPGKADIIEAFRLGITDYLLFPLPAKQFLTIIEKAVNDRRRAPRFALFRSWNSKLQKALKKKKVPISEDQEPMRLAAPLGLKGKAEEEEPFPIRENRGPPDLNVNFFGKFGIQVKGKKINLFPGEKINALLAYLLYSHRSPVHRETLLSKFWGHYSPVSARNSLNVTTYYIRRHLQKYLPEVSFIQYCDDNYSINPDLEIATDTDQFLYYSRQGQSIELKYGLEKAFDNYQKAASFYQGDFLEDIYYEEWCDAERDILKETYLLVLDRLGAYFFQKEVYAIAVNIFKKMLEKDSCLENAHRKLILCYYRLGLRDKAIRQYYRCAKALKEELNVEPSVPTRDLFELISNEENVPAIMF